MFIQCMAGRPEPSPPCPEWSFNQVSHRQLTKRESIGDMGANKEALEQPPCFQGPLAWLDKGRHPKSEVWSRGCQEQNKSQGV